LYLQTAKSISIREIARIHIAHRVDLDDMFQLLVDIDLPKNFSGTSKGNLVVPCTRLKFGERAFTVAARRLWNELPSDIKKASTLTTFKNHLKTFLFCEHYGTVLEQSA